MLGFNFKNLAIIKPAVDMFDPLVVRASMGAIFSINFEYFNSIEEYISKFSAHHLYPFMLNGKSSIEK
jgi:TrmH family RNA methyltransferase